MCKGIKKRAIGILDVLDFLPVEGLFYLFSSCTGYSGKTIGNAAPLF